MRLRRARCGCGRGREGLEAEGAELPTETWINPTPIVTPIECRAATTTLVPFDLPIVTGRIVGSVVLDQVFCAAKFDCRDGFLDPDGPGDLTGILGFACTAGPGEETTLYLSDITVVCDGEPTARLNPALGGQRPVSHDVVFAVGTYSGPTSYPDLDMCYWNTALGLTLDVDNPATNPRNCRAMARGTAVAGGVDTLPGGMTPDNVRQPVITWNAPLTDGDGVVVCGEHPLNGPDGVVAVGYTDPAGETFRWPCECGDSPKVTCAGRTVTASGASIHVEEVGASGVQVEVGGAVTTIELPEGVTLDNDVGCCVSPCCNVAPAP